MERDLKLNFLQTEFYSFLCPNQLTKASTLRCRKVNRNVKFDYDESSLAFQSDLVKL